PRSSHSDVARDLRPKKWRSGQPPPRRFRLEARAAHPPSLQDAAHAAVSAVSLGRRCRVALSEGGPATVCAPRGVPFTSRPIPTAGWRVVSDRVKAATAPRDQPPASGTAHPPSLLRDPSAPRGPIAQGDRRSPRTP